MTNASSPTPTEQIAALSPLLDRCGQYLQSLSERQYAVTIHTIWINLLIVAAAATKTTTRAELTGDQACLGGGAVIGFNLLTLGYTFFKWRAYQREIERYRKLATALLAFAPGADLGLCSSTGFWAQAKSFFRGTLWFWIGSVFTGYVAYRAIFWLVP